MLNKKEEEVSDYDTKYIRVLDGVRALSIIIIVWFHFWQQSWIMPIFGSINLDFIPRYGFLLVDMMILLSGFCLFIPYARAMVYKEEMPKTKDFYLKRVARIFPSYYLSMIIVIVFTIILKGNFFSVFFLKDTLLHLFFIQNWSTNPSIYLGVLWTVAIEVQYYLIFPFLAKSFTKKPVLVYSLMMVLGLTCCFYIRSIMGDANRGYYVNHFLTFIPVYANGMLASWIYVKYTKNRKRKPLVNIFFTIISIAMLIVYKEYICRFISKGNMQEWQVSYRILLSFVFTIFILGTCLSSKKYQKLYNNRIMKNFAIISYNWYIYHQVISVKLKEWRIPYYSGDVPPNELGDKKWQWSYLILCIIISLTVAVLMTYLFEKPIAKYLKKKFKC